jgi:Ger(x)C family germination protein
MKLKIRSCLALLVAGMLLLTSCGDHVNLENAATLGLDLDQEGRLHYFSTTPVFSKNIKKKSSEISIPIESLRQSRSQQDALSGGTVLGRNYQVLLLGRKLLNQEGWFPVLDVLYRDARNTVTDRVIAVDGNVEGIIYLNSVDEPLLPILLRGMVDTKTKNSETYGTTVQELHRQFYDRGVTPYIAEIKMDKKKIVLKGAALLNRQGKYELSIGAQETVLLSIMQKQAAPGFSLTYHIPGQQRHPPFNTDILSFTGRKVKTKIKTGYGQGKFKFDFDIKLSVGLSEHLFPFNVSENAKQLEKQAGELMQKQMEGIIAKLQKHKIDPIGLGVYARAHEYRHYIQAEDHWGEELAKADISIKVDLTISGMGPVK